MSAEAEAGAGATTAAGGGMSTGASKSPAEFLKAIKGKPVLVKLNSGVDYRGR